MISIHPSQNNMFLEQSCEQGRWRTITSSQEEEEEAIIRASLKSSNQKRKEQRDRKLRDVKEEFPCANSVFINDWLQQGKSVQWIRSTLRSQEQLFKTARLPISTFKEDDRSRVDHVGKIISFEKDGSLPIPPPLPHGYLRRESSIITVEEAFIGVDSPRRILHDTDDTSQLSSMESSTTTTTQQFHKPTITIQSNNSLRVNSNGDQQPSLKPPARSSLPNFSRKDKNTLNSKLPCGMESFASSNDIEEDIEEVEKKHNRKQGNNELGIILCLFPTANPRRALDLLLNGSSLNEIIIILGREENESKVVELLQE